MYKIGKYLLEADNAVDASSAVICLNRRKSLEESGEVVLKGKRITYTLLKNKNWDIELSKTGYINEAGRCLVMQANIEGEDVSIVLLNSFGKLTPFGDSN